LCGKGLTTGGSEHLQEWFGQLDYTSPALAVLTDACTSVAASQYSMCASSCQSARGLTTSCGCCSTRRCMRRACPRSKGRCNTRTASAHQGRDRRRLQCPSLPPKPLGRSNTQGCRTTPASRATLCGCGFKKVLRAHATHSTGIPSVTMCHRFCRFLSASWPHPGHNLGQQGLWQRLVRRKVSALLLSS
jgi:hypothetical protein